MNKSIESLRGESSQEVDRPENWFDDITYLRKFFAPLEPTIDHLASHARGGAAQRHYRREHISQERNSHNLDLLSRMNELQAARREAGYERHMRLSELVFFGKWWSDTLGNLYRITDDLPENVRENSARHNRVVPRDDFWIYLKANGVEHTKSTFEGLPPAGICCPDCKKPWDMSNVADAVETRHSQDVPLDKYVGRQLGEVIIEIQQNHQAFAIWHIQSDAAVSNPSYIDTSPAHPGTSVQKNSAGVLRGDQSEHVIIPGDIAHFNVWEYRHPECQKDLYEQQASKYFRALFTDAGYLSNFTLVPNQYNNDPVNDWPWVSAELSFGKITIGWRKRVISISVENNDAVDLKTLFSEEGTDKGKKYIHAWNREKAVEYLKAIKAKYDVAQQ